MTFEEAAAIPHAAGLALQGLVDIGRIRPGDSVLINGAGGGVGTIGVQIAKQRGAAQLTGVDSAPKLETLRAAGFDRVIDYHREDFTRNGERYDLALDTKTNRSPFSYLRSLSADGRYLDVVSTLFEQHGLKLFIDRPYTLSEAASASAFRRGQTYGKDRDQRRIGGESRSLGRRAERKCLSVAQADAPR